MRNNYAVFAVIVLAICFVLISCSKGKDPVTPGSEDLMSSSTQGAVVSDRKLLGMYFGHINIEEDKAVMVPARTILAHMNLVADLGDDPNDYCTLFASSYDSVSDTLLLVINYSKPDYTNYYDVRGILLLEGNTTFDTDLEFGDATIADGSASTPYPEVSVCDGYTSLYCTQTVDYLPPADDAEEYEVFGGGDINSGISPLWESATINPYLRVLEGAAGANNNLYNDGPFMQTWAIENVTNPSLTFGYAIDASTSDNCEEPWKVVVTQEDVNDGLRTDGGSILLTLDIFDWDGKTSYCSSTGEPDITIDCPDVIDTEYYPVEWEYIGANIGGSGSDRYRAIVSASMGYKNTSDVARNPYDTIDPGDYRCLIRVEDNLNSSSDDWLDLSAYQVITLTVADLDSDDIDRHDLWCHTFVNYDDESSYNSYGELYDALDATEEGEYFDGYSALVLPYYCEPGDSTYISNAINIFELAANLDIDVIPNIVSLGYANSTILKDNPNLNAGQPVSGTQFSISNQTATVQPSFQSPVQNHEFETTPLSNGWGSSIPYPDWVTDPDAGQSDKCIELEPGDRIYTTSCVDVEEWQCYEVTFSAWSDDVTSDMILDVNAFGSSDSVFDSGDTKLNYYQYLITADTNDWVSPPFFNSREIIFNSQDFDTVFFEVMLTEGNGTLYVDDFHIDNAGLKRLIRNDEAEIVIKYGLYTLREGTDYLVDDSDVPCEITFTALWNGLTVTMDYCHDVFIYRGQAACTLVGDDVYDEIDDTLDEFDTAMAAAILSNDIDQPEMTLVSADEIRVMGWMDDNYGCPASILRDGAYTLDTYIATHSMDVFAWGDMFDPNFNAVNDYFLVNGNLSGSWSELDTYDWLIGNWNYGARSIYLSDPTNRADSMIHFDDTCNVDQVLCGYWDQDDGTLSGAAEFCEIENWLFETIIYDIEGANTIMYTSWDGWDGSEVYEYLDDWRDRILLWEDRYW